MNKGSQGPKTSFYNCLFMSRLLSLLAFRPKHCRNKFGILLLVLTFYYFPVATIVTTYAADDSSLLQGFNMFLNSRW